MTHNTRESAKKVLKEYYGYKSEQDVPDGLAAVLEDWLHHQLQKAREEERDRILSNILKWSKTVTVTETTGREGAKRATTKLRNSLAGCYHFLYQALRINHSELDHQPDRPLNSERD